MPGSSDTQFISIQFIYEPLITTYLPSSIYLCFIYASSYSMFKTYECKREKGRKYSSYIGVPICVCFLVWFQVDWFWVIYIFFLLLLKKRKETKSFVCFHLAVDGIKMNSFLLLLFLFFCTNPSNPRSNIKILNFNSFSSYNFRWFIRWVGRNSRKILKCYIFYLQIKIKFICECWFVSLWRNVTSDSLKLYFLSFNTLSSSCVSSSFLFCVFIANLF